MQTIHLVVRKKYLERQEGFSMKNIYTIKFELSNIDSIPYIDLEDMGSFILLNNDVCLFSDLQKKDIRNKLFDCLDDESQFIVKSISKTDIDKLPDRFAEWAKPLVFNDEIKDFEKHNQELLNKTMKYLEELDKDLGGVNVGKQSNKQSNKQKTTPATVKNKKLYS